MAPRPASAPVQLFTTMTTSSRLQMNKSTRPQRTLPTRSDSVRRSQTALTQVWPLGLGVYCSLLLGSQTLGSENQLRAVIMLHLSPSHRDFSTVLRMGLVKIACDQSQTRKE